VHLAEPVLRLYSHLNGGGQFVGLEPPVLLVFAVMVMLLVVQISVVMAATVLVWVVVELGKPAGASLEFEVAFPEEYSDLPADRN